jgi:hypothetical protein
VAALYAQLLGRIPSLAEVNGWVGALPGIGRNGVAFIGRINSLQGSSTEAKEKAVADFFTRMTALERQLGRICEELELG